MRNLHYCSRARLLINRQLDSECRASELEVLDRHLVSCAHCRSVYRSARSLEILLGKLAIKDVGSRMLVDKNNGVMSK